jgi:hypothetical protein
MIDTQRAVEASARNGAPVCEFPDGDSRFLYVCVVQPESGNPIEVLEDLLQQARGLSARTRVRSLGEDRGYRLEDATAVVIGHPATLDPVPLEAWMRRRLASGTSLKCLSREGPLALAMAISDRVGCAPGRTRYDRGPDGRVRVEAFELHVAEHCNLRCANCCNMSPLVARHFLSIAEVKTICSRMAGAVVADVLKIMGGEPLLHPEIAAIIEVLRSSGLGDRVRLFTNGLLLPSMPDAFWEALDEMTISNYSSAPLKPRVLQMARDRSRRHGFVLNVKPVNEFSQVLSPRFESDDGKTRKTFARCWLKHRCLVVRQGRFYMCTRAAYADDFLHHVAHQEPPAGTTLDRSGDGISIDDPDLPGRIEAYMNREEPLGACRYCFGGDGEVEPHYQLTRDDVARGVLSRALS